MSEIKGAADEGEREKEREREIERGGEREKRDKERERISSSICFATRHQGGKEEEEVDDVFPSLFEN